ncbi:SRSF protein kinase 2 [Aethina tumida]|uniref:SRSF protein kinase 2 n=1 Tax=Aethina tumida TaxID=116153 RepID=UPI00096B2597|nr:SRSF protein kinase 2 [Aethina tumida]
MSTKFNVNRRQLALKAKAKRYKKNKRTQEQHKKDESDNSDEEELPSESSSSTTTTDDETVSDSEIDINEDGDQEDSKDYCVGGYHPVRIGDVFLNRYHVNRKIGWGYFSTVWLCWDLVEMKFVAMKIVKSAEHFNEAAIDEIRILKEIRQADVNDPHREKTVQLLHDFKIGGVNGVHICMVFEVLGCNLLRLIIKSRYKGIPINNVKTIIRQVLEGLEYLHDKCSIIHTDIKPENILLCVSEESIMKMACEAAQLQLIPGTKLPTSLVSTAPSQEQKISKNKKKKLKKKYKKHIELMKNEMEHLQKVVTMKKTETEDRLRNTVPGDSEVSELEVLNQCKGKIEAVRESGEPPTVVIKKDQTDKDIIAAPPTPPPSPRPPLTNLDPALYECDIQIKIADLGNACYVHKHYSDEIQTRQYRSVEVLIGAEYNVTADIWSTACVAFELATGDYLFEPHSSCHFSRDEDHLAHIIELLGDIPPHIIKTGRYSRKFFDSKNKLKHICGIKRWRLQDVLTEKYKWNLEDALSFQDFLLPMLDFDPNTRATASQCLRHPWLYKK